MPTFTSILTASALSFVEVQFIPIEAVDTLLDNPRFVDDAAALRRFKVWRTGLHACTPRHVVARDVVKKQRQ